MNKFSSWLVGLAGLVLATTAGAVSVTLNGTTKNVASISITHTEGGIQITSAEMVFSDGSGGVEGPTDPEPTDPEPTDPEPTDPEPTDPPSTGDCVVTATQKCGSVINWANPGPRTKEAVVGTDTTLTWPFTTTSDPNLAGAVNIATVVGFESVGRRVWISSLPGGEPRYPDWRCMAEGSGSRSISWSQQPNRARCALEPNTTYYLNIKNTFECSAGRSCQFYRTLSVY